MSGLSSIGNPIFVERFDKIRALVLVAIQRPCLWCLCGDFFFNHFFFCWFVCCFWRFLYQISGCISANHQTQWNLSKRQKLELKKSQRSYCCKLHVATSSPTQISTTTQALILDCSNNSHCCKGAYIKEEEEVDRLPHKSWHNSWWIKEEVYKEKEKYSY
jgi:hypothetical protein